MTPRTDHAAAAEPATASPQSPPPAGRRRRVHGATPVGVRGGRAAGLATAALLLAVTAAVTTTGPAAAAPPGVATGRDFGTVERVDAADPTAAAVAISRLRFPEPGVGGGRGGGADYAVLARDDDYADALSGAPLTLDGPMLLTDTDRLPAATAAELARVLPDGGRVYLLGGPAAISHAVAAELERAGHEVVRLAGASRVETSLAVADAYNLIVPFDSTVALARAYAPEGNPTAGWADAVSGGGWAAWHGVPVLLTPGDALHPAVAAWMDAHDAPYATLFGGTAALSQAVEDAVDVPQRAGGLDRAGTAAAIADEHWPQGTRRYVVVNGYRGDGWAFGLPAAGLSADHDAAVLLAATDALPPATAVRAAAPCAETDVDHLLIGDTTVLSDAVAEQLAAPVDGECAGALADDAAQIEAQAEANDGGEHDLRVSCPEVEAVSRGQVFLCDIDQDDPGLDDPQAALIVRDDQGNTSANFGTGLIHTVEEFALEPGAGCDALRDGNHTYFDAVLYWFLTGAPAGMDDDGDGRPCEAQYPADVVERFWAGTSPFVH